MPAASKWHTIILHLGDPRRCATAIRDFVIGPPDDRILPRRVQEEIDLEQQRADTLIGFVQVLLCILFATLYFVSRKTQPIDAPFSPVPWALSAYSLFVALRVTLAWDRPLPNWLQVLSIVFDFSLLLGLIWSFHIQYSQVPAFYLKAPTLLYVFIFIALRALRFEVMHVVIAGSIAALGWLALVVYAAHFGPDPMPATRDYVTYMTSAVILWGAEVDKIISILLVTLILVVAIKRSRRLLLRAAAEGHVARDLKRFFAPDVATRITTSDDTIRPGQGEIRDAALLFIDIRGFTELSHRLGASELVALLAEYRALLAPVIERHGGSIDKFIGDGVLASFGAVRATPTYAADALRAVEDLLAALNAWQDERTAHGLDAVRFGVGVATGAVVVGVIGDETRLEYTVIGEAVNLAAKLEKQTKTEQVAALALAAAYQLALGQGYMPRVAVDRRNGTSVLGVEATLDLVALAA